MSARFKTIFQTLGLAAAYVVAEKLGLLVAPAGDDHVIFIWPPTGIALAGCVVAIIFIRAGMLSRARVVFCPSPVPRLIASRAVLLGKPECWRVNWQTSTGSPPGIAPWDYSVEAAWKGK